jgi:GAF domain-containing protein
VPAPASHSLYEPSVATPALLRKLVSEYEQVVVHDLRDEDRWGDYPAFAVERGCVAVLGIPMVVGDRTIGALNLYRHEPSDWDDETLEDAQLVADMATGYIVNHRTLSETRTLAEQLQRALESRTLIEQAKGILSERHGSDVGDAFQRLRSHARGDNERLHEVARAVVANELEL